MKPKNTNSAPQLLRGEAAEFAVTGPWFPVNGFLVEIIGNQVILRETREEDLSFLMNLWNDGRVMKWVGFPQGVGYTPESMQKQWKERMQHPGYFHFIAWNRDEQGKPLERCGEVHYRVEPGVTRVGLDIKFTPESQGRGYATEALRLLIDQVFSTVPNATEVWTEPNIGNTAAEKLYTRCGLREKARPADMPQGPRYWALERERWAKAEENA